MVLNFVLFFFDFLLKDLIFLKDFAIFIELSVELSSTKITSILSYV